MGFRIAFISLAAVLLSGCGDGTVPEEKEMDPQQRAKLCDTINQVVHVPCTTVSSQDSLRISSDKDWNVGLDGQTRWPHFSGFCNHGGYADNAVTIRVFDAKNRQVGQTEPAKCEKGGAFFAYLPGKFSAFEAYTLEYEIIAYDSGGRKITNGSKSKVRRTYPAVR